MPSFSKMWKRYFLMVCWLRLSSPAIWRLPRPSATSATTCSSRGVSRRLPRELSTRSEGTSEMRSITWLSCSVLAQICPAATRRRHLRSRRRLASEMEKMPRAPERNALTTSSRSQVSTSRTFGISGWENTALYAAYVTSIRCCIPEFKVDLQKLIGFLISDKKNNPSNYSLVILSEGAEWEGYAVKEYGEADAFGHRKKMSVAEDLSNEIKAATGEETIVSDLTYDLRSGSADFVDRMVASTFAGMAIDAIAAGKKGLMTAISGGCYAMVGIPDPKLGPRKVDVASMYNTERYRPTYDTKAGLPIFLTRA